MPVDQENSCNHWDRKPEAYRIRGRTEGIFRHDAMGETLRKKDHHCIESEDLGMSPVTKFEGKDAGKERGNR